MPCLTATNSEVLFSQLLYLFNFTFIYIPVLLCLEIYTSIRRRQRKELYQPIDTTRKYMSDPLSISRCHITWHKPEGESIIQVGFSSYIICLFHEFLIKKSYTISLKGSQYKQTKVFLNNC